MAEPLPSAAKPLRFILGAAVLTLLAFGVWYVAFRPQADPELSLADRGTGRLVDLRELEGTWTVVPGQAPDATVAGYRVREVFAAGARKNTATARTSAVRGRLTVQDGTVTGAAVTVDLRQLSSKEPRRDAQLSRRGLETARYPTARFRLDGAVALPELRDGKVATIRTQGLLTLHGTTRRVVLPLHVRVAGDAVTIEGSASVRLGDYGIEAPSISGFVRVEDQATFEFLVQFREQRR